MTSGPIDKVTMKLVAMTPAGFRSKVHPATSRFVEKWSPFRWYRNLRADVFMLWFPKTGGTWARLLLHTALTKHFGVVGAPPLEVEPLADFDPRIPRIRPFHDDAPHWKRPEQLRTHKRRYKGRKVMLLVRDPRDAIISLHLQVTKRWKVDPDVSLDDFIWQRRGSFQTMIRFYNIWAQNRHVPSELLLLRYEDMRADPEGYLRKMLDFVGVTDVPDAIIREAVEYNEIERLRAREAAGIYDTRRLQPGDPNDPDSFKARKGKVGGFREVLEPEDIEKMTRIIEEELDPWYGYPISI
ncbi:MAG: sulfotransferase domain-containing protein [Myxococcales bacterium]|jgi:hypothetical protein|nr:sulfotransferase domain-containing protein [Myxococcales bacterium]